jgi:hypothetical protein
MPREQIPVWMDSIIPQVEAAGYPPFACNVTAGGYIDTATAAATASSASTPLCDLDDR